MPRTGHFYPSISYLPGPTVINFGDGDEVVDLRIAEAQEQTVNRAVAGAREVLTYRTETQVALVWQYLTKATLDSVRTWWTAHAKLGGQSILLLDRLTTCTGQWEYDTFNAVFTKAELLNNPFAPVRGVKSRARYSLELLFRQGV